jgi:Caspase domain
MHSYDPECKKPNFQCKGATMTRLLPILLALFTVPATAQLNWSWTIEGPLGRTIFGQDESFTLNARFLNSSVSTQTLNFQNPALYASFSQAGIYNSVSGQNVPGGAQALYDQLRSLNLAPGQGALLPLITFLPIGSVPIGTYTFTEYIQSQNLGYSPAVFPFTFSVVNKPPPPTASPRVFGLFIGVDTQSASGPSLHADTMATNLATAFNSHYVPLNGIGYALTAPLGGNVTAGQISSQLATIKGQMTPGVDTLVVYLNGHGISDVLPSSGFGNDSVYLGSNPSDRLYDKQLYSLLSNFDPTGAYRKITFVDACHAGGFWNKDILETGTGDLDILPNTAFFGSASEWAYMYYGTNGLGFYSQALLEAMATGLENFSSLQALNTFLTTRTKQIGSGYPVFYQGEFGDPIPGDPALLGSTFGNTPGFNLVGSVVPPPVPEPSIAATLLSGFVLLLVTSRRRFQNQVCGESQ